METQPIQTEAEITQQMIQSTLNYMAFKTIEKCNQVLFSETEREAIKHKAFSYYQEELAKGHVSPNSLAIIHHSFILREINKLGLDEFYREIEIEEYKKEKQSFEIEAQDYGLPGQPTLN